MFELVIYGVVKVNRRINLECFSSKIENIYRFYDVEKYNLNSLKCLTICDIIKKKAAKLIKNIK